MKPSKVYKRMPDSPNIDYCKSKRFAYVLNDDTIEIPNNFKGGKLAFYIGLFHEIIHSTGHPCRLNRLDWLVVDDADSRQACLEECVAELGALLLLSHTKLRTKAITENVEYLRGYIKTASITHREMKQVIAKAKAAVRYVLNK